MKMTSTIKKRFLVVDDEPAIRKLLSGILSEAGHDVDMAENGKDALQMLNKTNYDLIISDVNMPEMDGISFYRAISENLPEIKDKILFVTGNSTNEVMSFFKKHDCKYIAKPNLFDESGLLDQIKSMLDK